MKLHKLPSIAFVCGIPHLVRRCSHFYVLVIVENRIVWCGTHWVDLDTRNYFWGDRKQLTKSTGAPTTSLNSHGRKLAESTFTPTVASFPYNTLNFSTYNPDRRNWCWKEAQDVTTAGPVWRWAGRSYLQAGVSLIGGGSRLKGEGRKGTAAAFTSPCFLWWMRRDPLPPLLPPCQPHQAGLCPPAMSPNTAFLT